MRYRLFHSAVASLVISATLALAGCDSELRLEDSTSAEYTPAPVITVRTGRNRQGRTTIHTRGATACAARNGGPPPGHKGSIETRRTVAKTTRARNRANRTIKRKPH